MMSDDYMLGFNKESFEGFLFEIREMAKEGKYNIVRDAVHTLGSIGKKFKHLGYDKITGENFENIVGLMDAKRKLDVCLSVLGSGGYDFSGVKLEPKYTPQFMYRVENVFLNTVEKEIGAKQQSEYMRIYFEGWRSVLEKSAKNPYKNLAMISMCVEKFDPELYPFLSKPDNDGFRAGGFTILAEYAEKAAGAYKFIQERLRFIRFLSNKDKKMYDRAGKRARYFIEAASDFFGATAYVAECGKYADAGTPSVINKACKPAIRASAPAP